MRKAHALNHEHHPSHITQPHQRLSEGAREGGRRSEVMWVHGERYYTNCAGQSKSAGKLQGGIDWVAIGRGRYPKNQES
eukprot:scaffold553_cov184-Chaetoceros_neogracile.AAC.6